MGIKRGTVAIFASTVFRNIVSFGAVAYFSRSVGVGALGSFFLFQSVITILSVPSDLGIRKGVEKRLSEGEAPGEVLATALALKIGLFVAFSFAIFLLQGVLQSFIGADVVPLLIIGLLLNELGGLGRRALLGEQRISETAFFEPVRTGAWAVFGALLIEFGGAGPESLIYAYIIGLLLVAIIAAWRVDTPIGRPSVSRARSLFSYSKFAAISPLGGIIYNWTDVVFLGFFVSQAAVGAYEVAWRVATASLLLSSSIRVSLFPEANRLGAEGDIDGLETLVKDSLIPALYFVIPTFVGVLVLGEQILAVIFDVRYPLIGTVLIILMIEKLLRGTYFVFIAPMHAVGRVDLEAYTTVLGAVTNVLLNLLLIPQHGVVGAAIATTLGAAANAGSHIVLLSRQIDIRMPVWDLLWCTTAASIMGAILFVIVGGIDPSTVPEVAGLIAVGGLIYGIVSLASESIRQEIFSYLDVLR